MILMYLHSNLKWFSNHHPAMLGVIVFSHRVSVGVFVFDDPMILGEWWWSPGMTCFPILNPQNRGVDSLGHTERLRGIIRIRWLITAWMVVSKIFDLYPYLGKWSNLTNFFSKGLKPPTSCSIFFCFLRLSHFEESLQQRALDAILEPLRDSSTRPFCNWKSKGHSHHKTTVSPSTAYIPECSMGLAYVNLQNWIVFGGFQCR